MFNHLIYTLNADIPYEEYLLSVYKVVPNSIVKLYFSSLTPNAGLNTLSTVVVNFPSPTSDPQRFNEFFVEVKSKESVQR
jgi:hypothetical protein